MKSLLQKHPNINTIIIISGIVLVWRGLWGLMDLYLFPHSPAMSYGIGLFVGLWLLYRNDGKLKELG